MKSKAIGSMVIPKGTAHEGEVKLFSWDAVQNCMNDRCPAYEECPYKKDDQGKCEVQLVYLKSLTSMIMRNFPEASEAKLFRIGMHLIPLYKQLSKLQIEELGVHRIVTVTDRGNRAMNPLYKEIREHIRLIESMWHSIGLQVSVGDVPESATEMMKSADTNYYDTYVLQKHREKENPIEEKSTPKVKKKLNRRRRPKQ